MVRRWPIVNRRSLLGAAQATWLLWLCSGCQASASAQARASSDSNAELQAQGFADFDEAAIEDEAGSVGEFAENTNAPSGGALLGARHDVFVRAEPVENCRCISAVAGQPNDPRLGWESRVPRIDENNQLVFAFRMANCGESNDEGSGVAYRGYRKVEANVVVMVEAAVAGRPQIRGAIIPRPLSGGQLLVEPFPQSMSLGQSLTGGSCTIEF